MNYDELLLVLKDYASSAGLRMDRNAWLILGDVVELHKPRNYKAGNWCVGCNADYEYPCPTIQAILKGVE